MPNVTWIASGFSVDILKQLKAGPRPGDSRWLALSVVTSSGSESVRAVANFSYGTICGRNNSEPAVGFHPAVRIAPPHLPYMA